MVLTIVSPDKTSISMFLDFYKTVYDQDVSIYIFNSLFSSEVLENKLKLVQEAENENDDLKIFIFKIDFNCTKIPKPLEKKSIAIIKFDLFSNTPEIIKNDDKKGEITAILDRWNMNMEKLNKS